jgi:hypothetical protein
MTDPRGPRQPTEPPLTGEIGDFPLQLTRSVAAHAAQVFRLIGGTAYLAADAISALADALVVDQTDDERQGELPEEPQPADRPTTPPRTDIPESP